MIRVQINVVRINFKKTPPCFHFLKDDCYKDIIIENIFFSIYSIVSRPFIDEMNISVLLPIPNTASGWVMSIVKLTSLETVTRQESSVSCTVYLQQSLTRSHQGQTSRHLSEATVGCSRTT